MWATAIAKHWFIKETIMTLMIRKVIFILCLVGITFLTSSIPRGYAQTDYAFNLLTQFDASAPQYPMSIHVVGDVVYTADPRNFAIVEMREQTTPTLLSSLTFDTGSPHDGALQVVDEIAYVSNEIGGLRIVDVTDPNTPVLLGLYDGLYVYDHHIMGHVAYIAGGSDGFLVVDVSDLTAPTLLSSYSPNEYGYSKGIDVIDQVAYIVDSINGLMIFDVSDPISPLLLSSLDMVGWSQDVTVVGNIAYIADGYNGLVSVDITDLIAPTVLGSIETEFAMKVAVVDDVAFVADHHNGLLAVDVSDPSNPTLLDSASTFGDAYDLYVSNDVIYVVSRIGGVYLFEYVPAPEPMTYTVMLPMMMGYIP